MNPIKSLKQRLMGSEPKKEGVKGKWKNDLEVPKPEGEKKKIVLGKSEKATEDEKPVKKLNKFREIVTYIWAGFLLFVNVAIGVFLWIYRQEYFNTAIDFGRTIEFGFLLLKIGLLIVVLVVDLKTLNGIRRQWEKTKFIEYRKLMEGEEGYKRMGIFKKMWFYWKLYEARSWVDKYNLAFLSLTKKIGRIKGKENRELKRMKEEMIKGILIWEDDFQILKYAQDKNGEPVYRKDKEGNVYRVRTNEPVDEEFLKGLYIHELYEDYLLPAMESADRFINGVSPEEKVDLI